MAALVDTDEVIRTERAWDAWASMGGEGDKYVSKTICRRAALLEVEEHLIVRFTDPVCQRIAETLSYVADRHGQPDVVHVRVHMALPAAGSLPHELICEYVEAGLDAAGATTPTWAA